MGKEVLRSKVRIFSMPEIPWTYLFSLSLSTPLSPTVIGPHPCVSPQPHPYITYFLQSPPVKKFIVISWVAYKSVKSHFNSLAFMWVD